MAGSALAACIGVVGGGIGAGSVGVIGVPGR